MQRLIRSGFIVRSSQWRSLVSTYSSVRPPNGATSNKKDEDEEDYLAKTSRLTRWFAKTFEATRLVSDPDLRRLIAQGFTALSYGTGFTVLLGTIGVDTTPMLTSLGATGLTLGLALKDGVAQTISGCLLVVQRPFKSGDVIRVRAGALNWHGLVLSVDHQYVRVQLVESTPGQERGGVVSIPSSIVHGNPIVVEPSTEAEKSMQQQRVEGQVLPDETKNRSTSRVMETHDAAEPLKDRSGEEFTMEKNRQLKESMDKLSASNKKK